MVAAVVLLEMFAASVTASALTGTSNVIVLVGEAVVGCIGAWLLVRSRQARQSISDAADARKMAGEWRENYLAEREARADAEQIAAEQREAKHAALNDVAALRSQTDLTAVMTALIEIQKTGTKTGEVLDKIARRFDQLATRLEKTGSAPSS